MGCTLPKPQPPGDPLPPPPKPQPYKDEKIKLLLLGAAESGKSTIFKQMRILYGSPKTDENLKIDLKMYGVVVRSNIIVAIRKLCNLLKQLGLEYKLDEESRAATVADLEYASYMTPRQAYDQVVTYLVDDTATEPYVGTINPNDWIGTSPILGKEANKYAKQFLHHVKAIRVLWQSCVMQSIWNKRALVNVNDSHKDYLQDLTRIASPDYKPTEHDILISRIRTTQVTKESYKMNYKYKNKKKSVTLEVTDVGGQRLERVSWRPCFESAGAVVFVAALSEYDQYVSEARGVNRMIEALGLFESVAKNQAFEKKPIMLFLNKKDIFAEKVEYSDISAIPYFSDYDGAPNNFDEGVMYFIKKFQDRLYNHEMNDLYIHVTCATDTSNMRFVLDSITHDIMLRVSNC